MEQLQKLFKNFLKYGRAIRVCLHKFRKIFLALAIALITIVAVAFWIFSGTMYRLTFCRSNQGLARHWGQSGNNPIMENTKQKRALWQKWCQERSPQLWEVRSSDQLHLRARFFKSDSPNKKLVILLHGYRGDPLGLTEHAQLYEGWGFNVLLPSLRAHGESEGEYISFGWHDSDDLLLWINMAIEKLGADIEIVLHGLSMGAATVGLTAGLALPPQVKYLVADCPYDSLDHIFHYQMRQMFHLPLPFPLKYFLNHRLRSTQGFTIEQVSVLNAVKKTTRPILFIHGDQDKFVPAQMSKALFNAVPNGLAQRIEIAGAPHYLSLSIAPKEYAASLEQFFQRKAPPTPSQKTQN